MADSAPANPPPATPSCAARRFAYDLLAPVVLLASAATLFFWRPDAGNPFGQTDCWVAQTAREMQERGDWIVPSFCGAAWINKTPLPYWQLILASNLLGRPIDVGLTRAFGALSALGMVLVGYALARFAWGLRPAVFTGFTLAASVFLLDYSHSGSSDIQVSFWCMASLAAIYFAFNTAWSRAWMAVAYIAAGLGMLSKGPVPLPVVGLPAAIYITLLWLAPRWVRGEPAPAGPVPAPTESQVRVVIDDTALPATLGARFVALLRRLHLPWGLPLFLLVAGTWVALLIPGLAHRLHDGDWSAAWLDFRQRMDTEFLQRMTGDLPNIIEERYWPAWYYLTYYLPFVFFNYLPWTLSVLPALGWAFLRRHGRDRNLLIFAWIYFIAVLSFFSISHGKEGRYVTAALPPLGLLLGHHLAAVFSPGFVRQRWLVKLACWSAIIVIPIGCLVGYVLLGPPAWVQYLAGLVNLTIPNLTVQLGLDPAVQPGFAVVAAVLNLGFVAAAVAYNHGRCNLSFALMVVAMFAGYAVYRPTLDRFLHSRDHFGVYAFAEQLGRIVEPAPPGSAPSSGPAEGGLQRATQFRLRATSQPVRLLASDNRDARVIWATNLKVPRVVDQFEFLREQGGRRTVKGDLELGVRRAMAALRDPADTLLWTEISPLAYPIRDAASGAQRPTVKDGYLMRLLCDELATMKKAPYLWLQVPTTPPGARQPLFMALVGNFPPPPELGLGEVPRVTPATLNVANPTTLPTAEAFDAKLQSLEQR